MEKVIKTTILPLHIAMIMDGNRRWAAERNQKSFFGHEQGEKTLRKVIEWLANKGVKIQSYYAFSTENWQRSTEEVNFLMKLFSESIKNRSAELHEKGFRVIFSGRYQDLAGDLPELCQEIMQTTRENRQGIINFCLYYGGRAELVDAFKRMSAKGINSEQIHEGIIAKYLDQPDLPAPDLIVRTGGQMRLSNFLLWQSAYAELIFLKKYWPDIESTDIDFILAEYANRQRNFGK